MKSALLRIIGHPMYAIVTAASLVLIVFALLTKELTVKDVVTALLAMLGTFMGATLAFRLSENKEEEKLKREQHEALNRAMFILARQHNALQFLKQDFERFKTPLERGLNLPALKPPPYSDLVQNFASIDFMLGEDPDLLFRLTVEQERFHQAIESLNVRNDFYVKELQPALSNLAINGKRVSVAELSTTLGERLFGGAISGAEVAYDHLSKSNESLPAIQAELLKYARSRFPGRKFVVFESKA